MKYNTYFCLALTVVHKTLKSYFFGHSEHKEKYDWQCIVSSEDIPLVLTFSILFWFLGFAPQTPSPTSPHMTLEWVMTTWYEIMFWLSTDKSHKSAKDAIRITMQLLLIISCNCELIQFEMFLMRPDVL